MNPKDINDSIVMALGSPLGLLSCVVFAVAIAIIGTWLVRGWFDKFVTWKAFQETLKKEKEESAKIHRELSDTVESNGRYAIAEVTKVGQNFLRMMDANHMENAKIMRETSEELVEVAKISKENTLNVSKLLGAYEFLLASQGIDINSLSKKNKNMEATG